MPSGAAVRHPATRPPRPIWRDGCWASGSLPVIAELRALGVSSGQDERDVLLWLFSPTTYLAPAGRPIDLLVSDPGSVLDIARQAWNIEW